ncbi:MAG: diguanylate cyclase [Acholeplasmataceae bacterium]|nr:diguanylate cyclase [Acholeplasmataceae bacterium]
MNVYNLISGNTVDLFLNAMFLFVLFFIYSKTRFINKERKLSQNIFAGFVIGIFMVMIMMTPFVAESGIFFDTRTVLISMTGVFFGFQTTLVAGTMGIIYRIFVGGSGTLTGVLSITSAALIGLYWKHIRMVFPPMKKTYEYFVLGLIVHVVTLIGFLTLPKEHAFKLIGELWFPYLTIYPIISMLIGVRIEETKDEYLSHLRLKDQQTLLQAMLDSAKTTEMFAVDTEGKYLTYNDFHRKAMRKYYGIKVQEGMSYLDAINIPPMRERIGQLIDDALKGQSTRRVFEVESEPDKYLEEFYAPIENDEGVIGVTVFSRDVTDRISHEQALTHASMHDALTGLKNRWAYSKDVDVLEQERVCPVAIAFLDINGLKITNDAFGHEAGDDLLKLTAKTIIELISNQYAVYRIGGDEFSILMPKTSLDEAEKIMEEIASGFSGKTHKRIPVSIAYGVSVWACKNTFQAAVKDAEDKMYAYKLFAISSHRNIAIKTILNTLQAKNPREERHSARVSKLCRMIGGRLEMTSHELMCLESISHLHDIGKIGISDAILNKEGPLDSDEWIEIRKHPEIGYRILSSTPDYVEIASDILSHHERYDGKGYPRGLKAEDIPIRARIIAIADAYDAMTSQRPYRKPLTHEEAIEEIRKNRGTQFDPKVADIFIEEITKATDLQG